MAGYHVPEGGILFKYFSNPNLMVRDSPERTLCHKLQRFGSSSKDIAYFSS